MQNNSLVSKFTGAIASLCARVIGGTDNETRGRSLRTHAVRARFIVAMAIGLLLTCANQQASAFNGYGHMVVAAKAYENLTPATKARVNQLLRLNPYYAAWKTEIGPVKSQDELDKKVFMKAATWPDDIKGDKSYFPDGADRGWRPSGPGASQNTGYNDKQLHMYWHFYDQPFSTDGTPLPVVPAPNAATQVQAFRTVLASSTATDDLKSYDLTWMIHIVGDIHQPLHSTTRVSKKTPNGDSGGNFVKLIKSAAGDPSNLHSFWDEALGGDGNFRVAPDPDKVIATASRLPQADKTASKDLNVDHWIRESSTLAQKSVYGPLGSGNGPFKLSPTYIRQAQDLIAKQGALAGERLANLLNSELK